MTVLQSILAHRIDLFLAEIAGKLDNILPALQKKAKALMPILFEGNGYSADWVLEAQKRGLPNVPQAMQAFKAYIKPENIKIFEKLGVYSAEEITARYHVQVENYEKTLAIEHKTLESLYLQYINHSVDKYIAFLRHAGLDDAKMLEKRKEMNEKWEIYAQNLAQVGKEPIWQVQKDFALNLQKDFNWLEKHIPQNFWDLPKYQDLLCF
jgi:glutamine synthetase